MILDFTEIWCDDCECVQPVAPCEMGIDELNPGKSWTDLVCDKCRLVIATVSKPV